MIEVISLVIFVLIAAILFNCIFWHVLFVGLLLIVIRCEGNAISFLFGYIYEITQCRYLLTYAASSLAVVMSDIDLLVFILFCGHIMSSSLCWYYFLSICMFFRELASIHKYLFLMSSILELLTLSFLSVYVLSWPWLTSLARVLFQVSCSVCSGIEDNPLVCLDTDRTVCTLFIPFLNVYGWEN